MAKREFPPPQRENDLTGALGTETQPKRAEGFWWATWPEHLEGPGESICEVKDGRVYWMGTTVHTDVDSGNITEWGPYLGKKGSYAVIIYDQYQAT